MEALHEATAKPTTPWSQAGVGLDTTLVRALCYQGVNDCALETDTIVVFSDIFHKSAAFTRCEQISYRMKVSTTAGRTRRTVCCTSTLVVSSKSMQKRGGVVADMVQDVWLSETRRGKRYR